MTIPPTDPNQPADRTQDGQNGYVLRRSAHHVQPSNNPAADLIRHKIAALYADEPNAAAEAHEAADESHRSKHQAFMYRLSTSGKSLAEIQAEWHRYYVGLPDHEKREVWQEFYAASGHAPTPHTQLTQTRSATVRPHISHAAAHPVPVPQQQAMSHNLHQPVVANAALTAGLLPGDPEPQVVVSAHEDNPRAAQAPHAGNRRNLATMRRQIMRQVHASNSAQLRAKQHVQSVAFGIGLGAFVMLIFLFGFFNEMVIAPFIQPNSHAEATPIILSQGSAAPSTTPAVTIPKINMQLPTVYSTSTTENDVQQALEDGVVHYASTTAPGEKGNAAFFGHSSNNIFNKGKYKFAFVLLHELVPGDLFYLAYNGKTYTYRVFQKQVVQPTDTWVLNPVSGKAATATLITCDPPGTSLHRLVVWGEQIDPDPNGNVAAAAVPAAPQPHELSSNGPTLLARFWHWATPW